MNCGRLYAAPIMLLIWALIIILASATAELIALRLITFSMALAVSLHELARRRRGQ